MENKEKKDLTLGQEIVKEGVSLVTSVGAGLIVGQIAVAVVESIPGLGKGFKFLMRVGAFGLEVATVYKVNDTVDKYIEDAFGLVNDVSKIFSPKKSAVAGAVEVDAEVK